MDFEEFSQKIKDINTALFKGYKNEEYGAGLNLGTPTISNGTGEQQSVLMLNINPHTMSTEERTGPHPLIYIPEEYGEKIRNCFDDKNLTWNKSGRTKPYKKAYTLVADKVKMFWAVNGEYDFFNEVGDCLCPEYKSLWKECLEKEQDKKANLSLIFADLFYQCDSSQQNIENHLKKQADLRDEKVKEIIGLYIDYYNPMLIIVTNVAASKLIYKSIEKKEKPKNRNHISYENTDILFTQMLFGQGTISNINYAELEQQVHNILH